MDVTLRQALMKTAEKAKGRKASKASAVVCVIYSVALVLIVDKTVGQKIDCVIELVKPDYLVLSVPSQPQYIAFAAVGDFNVHVDAFKSFKIGDTVQSTVLAVCD